MQKLLVAVDGSGNSLRAVRYVTKLARENGPISTHLVTAHEAFVAYGEIAVYAGQEKMERLQKERSEAILAEAESILLEGGVPCTKEILVGEIAPSIAKRAEELRCDAVVMGTRGMTSIANLVMGSVATKVIHLASIPVMLVK